MEELIKINQNIDLLVKEKYISKDDVQFIDNLSEIIQSHSNAISTNHTGFMTVQELSEHLNMGENEVEKRISSLVKRGILFEFISKVNIRNYNPMTSKRPLFMNPEIMYRGNVNMVDATLCTLVSHFDKIERKVNMPFKVFMAPDKESGIIYPREWKDTLLEEIQCNV